MIVEDLPNRLKNIDDVPKAIYAYGDSKLMYENKIIAIVGSRKPTPYGLRQAEKFAVEFARNGYVVISGFAVGIDTMAHKGAVSAGGRTIAVLGCGIAHDYPRSNRILKEEMLERHLFITEYSADVRPDAKFFPYRNRLISGLSAGVVVIESLVKSGTYWTVYHALKQGKPVFALPGSVESALSSGPNLLIKTGAIPVTEPKDILDYLTIDSQLSFY